MEDLIKKIEAIGDRYKILADNSSDAIKVRDDTNLLIDEMIGEIKTAIYRSREN